MTLDLSDEQLNTVVTAAVMQSISGESRDKLVQQAIAELLKRNNSGRFDNKSPLENALANAVQSVARTLIEQKLTSDAEFIARIDGLIVDAVRKLTETDRPALVDKMAKSLSAWLTDKDRY